MSAYYGLFCHLVQNITTTTERLLQRLNGECYKDSQHRVLPHQKDFSATNSIKTCLDYCRSKGYLYMGVQYRYQCFCGNKKPSESALASPSTCNHQCSGDKTETCGGDWRLNVYATSGKHDFPFCLVHSVVQPAMSICCKVLTPVFG